MNASSRVAELLARAGDTLPLRACDLCEHGVDIGSVRHCGCADVVLPQRPQPVHIARSAAGACGIEARFMSAPFLLPA